MTLNIPSSVPEEISVDEQSGEESTAPNPTPLNQIYGGQLEANQSLTGTVPILHCFQPNSKTPSQ